MSRPYPTTTGIQDQIVYAIVEALETLYRLCLREHVLLGEKEQQVAHRLLLLLAFVHNVSDDPLNYLISGAPLDSCCLVKGR